jgi:hypothetical protein
VLHPGIAAGGAHDVLAGNFHLGERLRDQVSNSMSIIRRRCGDGADALRCDLDLGEHRIQA